MTVIEFKSKRDKEYLLEKARKMEEYASMVIDCIENSHTDEEYNERRYRDDYDDDHRSRYDYRRMR